MKSEGFNPPLLRWRAVPTYARYGSTRNRAARAPPPAEWAAQLTPPRFRVLRSVATKPAYRNRFCRSYAPAGLQFCINSASLVLEL